MTQYITIAATVFLVLEVLIIGIGILIGYRRGLGRTLVRAVYLAIIGIVSFFVGRSIAATVTHTVVLAVLPMLPDEIVTMLEVKPELEILLEHLISALLVPVIFATLFAILQLLTLILFKKLSTKLVTAITKKEERTTAGKWTGAAAGLVLGIVIAAVLLSPMYTVLHVVENTPEDTITIFEDAIAENGTASLEANVPTVSSALRVQPHTVRLSARLSFRVSSFSFVSAFLTKQLTTYAIPEPCEGEAANESALNTLPVILATAGDALYAYNTTAVSGGASIDAITNAAAAVAPHLNESSTVRHIAADALYLVGVSFRDNGSFMGIELPETDNAILASIVNNLVDTLAQTTPDTVEANMKSLFGMSEIKYDKEAAKPHVSINKGLLSSMTKLDKDDPMKSLQDEALSDAVSSAIGNLADNENMSGVLSDIKDFAVGIIQDSDIDLTDEKYDSLYEEISQDLSDKISESINPETEEKVSVSEVAKNLEPTIESYFDAYDIPADSFQTSVIATCIAQEFYKEENIVDGTINVTVEEVLDFFGITQSDIDDFLNGGSSTENEGEGTEGEVTDPEAPVLPDDFDINDLPEDFDINDLPEDFDINDLPEDFDISDITGQ